VGTSYGRLPEKISPVPRNLSRAASALSRESLSVIVPLGIVNSVSPLKNHSKSSSPPSPNGCSGLSFGPSMNPSSDVENPAITLPMAMLLSFSLLRVSPRACLDLLHLCLHQ